MSKEEPAWKADMEGLIDDFLTGITMYGEVAETSKRIGELFTAAIGPHIVSAEQRGRREAAQIARAAAKAAEDTSAALGPNYNAINTLIRFADFIDPDRL